MRLSTRHGMRGNALLITFFLLTVAIVLVGMVLSETATVAQTTNRSRQYLAAQAAASGAVEYAYAVWYKRIGSKHDLLCSSSDLALSGPSFTGSQAPPGTGGFVYATDGELTLSALDKYGNVIKNGSNPDPVINTVPNYAGWYGRTYTYAATARMKPTNGDANAPVAGARRLFHYTEVPLFQCMFFFQDDLEIYNPATISIKGLIHTNKNLYLSVTKSSDLAIYGQATYVLSYSTKQPPGSDGSNYDLGNLSPPTWSNGGEAAQRHQVSTIWPMGPDLDSIFADSSYKTNINVTGGYHELIEPPSASYTDPEAISKRRIYNTAANKGGLIIQVSGTSIVGATTRTNVNSSTIAITTLDPTTRLPVPVAGKTTLIAAGDGASLPTDSSTDAYKDAVIAFSSALTKQLSTASTYLYDAREQAKMNVVNVDVGKLVTAVSANTSGIFSDVVYIYDSTSSTSTNAVRLYNGSSIALDDGLTIGSLNPVYIQGDYNTGGTGTTVPSNSTSSTINSSNTVSGYTSKPSAVIADAITLLSSNWSDSRSASSLSNRTASNTTYNVALLGGYIGSGSGDFSGGAVNYPRFLESWSSKYCTYYGSMVELFPSKSVTKPWDNPGIYYNAPNRRYNFDTTFSSKSPPGSVEAIVLSRGIWTKF